MSLDTITSFWKNLINTILHGTALRPRRTVPVSADVGAELRTVDKAAPDPGLPAPARVTFLYAPLPVPDVTALTPAAVSSTGNTRSAVSGGVITPVQ